MANETTLSVSVSFSKDGITFSKSVSASFDKSDGTYQSEVREVDDTGEQLTNSFGLNDAHTLLVINHGDYYVRLGASASAGFFSDVPPDDGMALFRVADSGSPPYAVVASTGQLCNLELIVIPD